MPYYHLGIPSWKEAKGSLSTDWITAERVKLGSSGNTKGSITMVSWGVNKHKNS